jgi:hypothetical protein
MWGASVTTCTAPQRCSRVVFYQWTREAMAFSTSARPLQDPASGLSCSITSVLYRPMVDSHSARVQGSADAADGPAAAGPADFVGGRQGGPLAGFNRSQQHRDRGGVDGTSNRSAWQTSFVEDLLTRAVNCRYSL